jgi:23S rRNA (adenine2030-N6)-methyltransferase
MNYRHAYHAGGFSDVFKHIILVAMLDALSAKTTALTYLDTHAGRGRYSLQSVESEKKKEYEAGIVRLINHVKTKPAPNNIQQYLDAVKAANPPETLCFYPGSPLIAQHCLREQDKMILCELHPEEYKRLKENVSHAAIHHMDAYLGMKAFLPPKTPRGLLHIDPPFEKPDEFQRIDAALTLAIKHWRNGHMMIWYPIKDRKVIEKFHRTLQSYNTPFFTIDFFMQAKAVNTALLGCGVALLNPPWKLKENLETNVLPYLAEALEAKYRIA